jgi:hypothetical protein
MTEQVLIIEEGVPLPPPAKTGPAPGGGLLGALSKMRAGQSTLMQQPDGVSFAEWRSAVSGLMAAASRRMSGTKLISRRDGDTLRIFCVAVEG